MDLKKNLAITLPFFYIILLTMSFAQEGTGDIINEIIQNLIPVIFILVFIIILLVIGGVIKISPRGGIPWLWILFISLIVILFILPQFIQFPQYLEVPEDLKKAPIPSQAAQALTMLGLPNEWMYVPAIIYLFILPFTAIFAIVWAFLQSLGIFTNLSPKINRLLAFIIAFLTIPIGWFTKLVWVLFSFMGAWSVVVFVATFIIGVFFRGFGVARREYSLALKTYESVGKELENQISELQKKVDELNSADIEREVNRLAEKYGGLYPKVKDLAAQVLQASDVNSKRNVVKNFKLQ